MAKPNAFSAIPADVLNTEQLAERLDYKVETVRGWARNGIVPGKCLGKEWRFWWPSVVIALFYDGTDEDDGLASGRPPSEPIARQAG